MPAHRQLHRASRHASTVLVTPPAAEPLTLAETKTFLRVDAADDDTLITVLIAAARRAGERFTRRAFLTQTWRLVLDALPAGEPRLHEGVAEGVELQALARAVELPFPPLQSVSALRTFDDQDTATVFAAANYFVDSAGAPGRVVLRRGQSWPTALRVANAVEIEFVAGYGATAADVPEELRHGMLMLAAHLYEHREAVAADGRPAPLPLGVDALWRPFRVTGI